jgi:hypothetical protein
VPSRAPFYLLVGSLEDVNWSRVAQRQPQAAHQHVVHELEDRDPEGPFRRSQHADPRQGTGGSEAARTLNRGSNATLLNPPKRSPKPCWAVPGRSERSGCTTMPRSPPELSVSDKAPPLRPCLNSTASGTREHGQGSFFPSAARPADQWWATSLRGVEVTSVGRPASPRPACSRGFRSSELR